MKTSDLSAPTAQLATQVIGNVAPWFTLGVVLLLVTACIAGLVFLKRRQLAKLKRSRRGRRKHIVVWM